MRHERAQWTDVSRTINMARHTGLFLLTLVTLCFKIGCVVSICNLFVYSVSRPEFNGYMGGVNHFIAYVTRTGKDCDRKCTLSRNCKGYLFDNATNECHLLNFTLSNTAGLTPRPEAVYFARIKILPGTFTCPSKVGSWYNVAGNDGCINVRPVHTPLTYDRAMAGCTSDGGRLYLVDNLHKWSLFSNLTRCPGFNSYYLIDGRNDNASNYWAADAYRASHGEVVPRSWPFWSSSSRYLPATEHCLYMHRDHLDTCSCDSTLHYLCERQD